MQHSWMQQVGVFQMLAVLAAAAACSVLAAASNTQCPPYNPDVNLNTPQTIRRHGYPAESHTIQTEDGYILTMHRIPGRRLYPSVCAEQASDSQPKPPSTTSMSSTTTPSITTTPSPLPRKRPILLQHGFLGSSYVWILAGPERALAYLLADAGYDVWLANSRGNAYSRAHAHFSTEPSSPYWHFSFHEVGIYDIPAEIDYILNVTAASKLDYIGHSMGTTAFFAMATTRPEMTAKIASSVMLAPVAFMRHIKSPIRLLAPFSWDAEYLAHILGEGEIRPRSKAMQYLAKYGCELLLIDKTLCENMIFIICGFDEAQFDQKLLPLISSHSSTGASTQTAIHYAQLINTGKFQQYDYGKEGNIKIYNSTEPPSYELSKVNASIQMYYASNDWLASVIDVNELYTNITCQKTKYLIPFPKFNHIDFIIAKDVKKLLYDKIIKQLLRDGNDSIDENNFV